MTSINSRLFILVFFALILTILPLPEFVLGLRPVWVLMLILYVQYFLSDYFNIAILLLIGIVLDVLLSTVLGEHTFSLAIVAWVASSKARRFSFFSMGQQMILIALFCLLYQLIILVIDTSQGYHPKLMMSLGSVLTSMLFWPWIKLIADDALFIKTRS